MTLDLRLAVRGDLRRRMALELAAGAKAMTSTIRRRTRVLKNNLRRQVARGRLGERLSKTVRDKVFPERGASLGAAGLVFSSATYRRPGGLVDIITVFDQGATVRPAGKKFIAIPTGRGGSRFRPGRGRSLRLSPPSDFSPGTFIVRKAEENNVLLLAFAKEPSVVAFVLVRQVRLRKRIDVQRAIAAAERGIDELFVRDWERQLKRAGIG